MSWSRARLSCSERKLNTSTTTSKRATIPNTLLVKGKVRAALKAAEGKAARCGRRTRPKEFPMPAEANGPALRERLSKAPVLSLRPTPTTRDPVLICGQAWVAAARHIKCTLWLRAKNIVCQPALRMMSGLRGFKFPAGIIAAHRLRGGGVEASWRDC